MPAINRHIHIKIIHTFMQVLICICIATCTLVKCILSGYVYSQFHLPILHVSRSGILPRKQKNEYKKNLYFLCFVAGPVYRSYSEFKPSGLKMNTTLPYVLQLDIVVSVSVPLLLYARVGFKPSH